MKDFLLATEALISAATPKSAGGVEVNGAAGLAKDTLMKLTKHSLYAGQQSAGEARVSGAAASD